MENIGLNVIEDKVKLQNEVHGVVVAQVKYGESEIEKREESRSEAAEKVAQKIANWKIIFSNSLFSFYK